MNINKKLDRFKQWTGEKMGGEAKTGVSDEFKNLELEMNLRHKGLLSEQFLCHGLSADCAPRYGQDAEVHDRIRQVSIKASRGRRQGEIASWRPPRLNHSHS